MHELVKSEEEFNGHGLESTARQLEVNVLEVGSQSTSAIFTRQPQSSISLHGQGEVDL